MPLSEIENTTWPDSVDTGRPINFGQDYKLSDPPSKQFRGPLTIRLSDDGFVYVGDEENDRIQVFTAEGKFVREFFIAPKTLDEGSVMDVALSHDPQQRYLLVADGSNQVVWVLNRKDGSVVTRFGHRGHSAGQFSYLHAVDADSHGSIYTGEVKYNYRIQKFVLSR
jgi:DNA-binding beta-propeller fold protein YncE